MFVWRANNIQEHPAMRSEVLLGISKYGVFERGLFLVSGRDGVVSRGAICVDYRRSGNSLTADTECCHMANRCRCHLRNDIILFLCRKGTINYIFHKAVYCFII